MRTERQKRLRAIEHALRYRRQHKSAQDAYASLLALYLKTQKSLDIFEGDVAYHEGVARQRDRAWAFIRNNGLGSKFFAEDAADG